MPKANSHSKITIESETVIKIEVDLRPGKKIDISKIVPGLGIG